MKHFYSHIIEVESIHASLSSMDLSPGEKDELVVILESSIHHVVLDIVMSELSSKNKKIFLSHIASEKHDEIWLLLKANVENVEEKIKEAVNALVKELHADIEEAKKTIM